MRTLGTCIVLTIFLTLASHGAGAGQIRETPNLLYLIQVNGVERGVLYLDRTADGYTARYSGSFRINDFPYFAVEKKGKVTRSGQLARISVERADGGNESFSVYPDIQDVPRDLQGMLKELTGAEEAASRAYIFSDKNRYPKMDMEKIPVVTLESIMLGSISNASGESVPNLLFEPASDTFYKVTSRPDGTGNLALPGGTCSVEKTILLRAGGPGQQPIPLMSMAVRDDRLPVQVRETSGKWEFALRAAGVKTTRSIDANKNSVDIYKKELASRFPTFTVDAAAKTPSARRDTLEIAATLRKPAAPSDLARHFAAYILRGNGTVLKRGEVSAKPVRHDGVRRSFFISVSKEEVCDGLRKGASGETFDATCAYSEKINSRRYERSNVLGILSNMADYKSCGDFEVRGILRKDLICTPGGPETPGKTEPEKPVDLRALAGGLMHGDQAAIQDVSLEALPGKNFAVVVSYREKKPVSDAVLMKAATDGLVRLLEAVPDGSANPFINNIQRNEQEYVVSAREEDVAMDYCSKIARAAGPLAGITVAHGEGHCIIGLTEFLDRKQADARVEKEILRMHPELNYDRASLRKRDGVFTYPVIETPAGGNDACLR